MVVVVLIEDRRVSGGSLCERERVIKVVSGVGRTLVSDHGPFTSYD